MTATDLFASVGGDQRLLHQHADLGKLPVLRLLQLLQLVLQLRDIALQFLDFFARAGRLRGRKRKHRRRKRTTRENASEHMQVSSVPGANGIRSEQRSCRRFRVTCTRAAVAGCAPVAFYSTAPAQKWARRFFCQQALVGFGALRTLLAVADGLQTVGGNSELHQEVLGGTGAAVAQAQVVFGRAALVAVAFHHDGGVREIGEDALERGGVAGQDVAGIAATSLLS